MTIFRMFSAAIRRSAASAAIAMALTAPHASGQSGAADTLYPGHRALRNAKLTMFSDTLRSYAIEKNVKRPLSVSIIKARESMVDGVNCYTVDIVHAQEGSDSSRTVIVMRRDNFALVHHRVDASKDSAEVTITGRKAAGWYHFPPTVDMISNVLPNPRIVVDTTLSRAIFPIDGPAKWFVTLLPLADSYAAVVPQFSVWAKGPVERRFEVVGTDLAPWGGKNFECWKVDTGPLGPPGYRSICWVEKSTRRVIQTALIGREDQREYWTHIEGSR